MITFEEIDKSDVKEKYSKYFHNDARYFKALKNNNTICFYGVIEYSNNECEAFLALDSFKGKVLTKDFFISLFKHIESIGFNKLYTWTDWMGMRRILEKFGCVQSKSPYWDDDKTKTWFVKRI